MFGIHVSVSRNHCIGIHLLSLWRVDYGFRGTMVPYFIYASHFSSLWVNYLTFAKPELSISVIQIWIGKNVIYRPNSPARHRWELGVHNMTLVPRSQRVHDSPWNQTRAENMLWSPRWPVTACRMCHSDYWFVGRRCLIRIRLLFPWCQHWSKMARWGS